MAWGRRSGAGGSEGLQQSGRIGDGSGPAGPLRRGAPARDCYSFPGAWAGIGPLTGGFFSAQLAAVPPARSEQRRRDAVAGAATR